MSHAEKVVLEQKDSAHWVYRGEGAANLVLAYAGPSALFAGKVLRIQKLPRGRSKSVNASAISALELLVWKDICDLIASPTRAIAQQLYVENVMIPLLGSQHVDAEMRVNVSREFLELVEMNVCSQRPAWRVGAADINFNIDFAVLMSDHSVVPRGVPTSDPCICVELKPKCGFLPSSRFIADRNAVKRRISRFRLHQLLKLNQMEISCVSEYNPLDLFSHSKDRVNDAITALFSTPQNNLRVFLNGSLVFGCLGGCSDATNSLTSKALKSALTEIDLSVTSFMELVAETLLKSRVLNSLLEVQKLDNLDIEGAIHAYYDVVSQPCVVCRSFGDDGSSDKYVDLHAISMDSSLRIVRDYLIAATAKDCSLMISFRPNDGGIEGSSHPNVCLESTGQSFNYKARFIDLDMKPLWKMAQYYKLDQKIVSCYIQNAKAQHESC